MKTVVVIQRELQENLRNYKTLFLLMFIFGGILMALYTEVGPTANSQNVLDPFFELFAVLCPMIGILAAMDAVVGEKEKGTLELILSKPLPRRSLLLGKFWLMCSGLHGPGSSVGRRISKTGWPAAEYKQL